MIKALDQSIKELLKNKYSNYWYIILKFYIKINFIVIFHVQLYKINISLNC